MTRLVCGFLVAGLVGILGLAGEALAQYVTVDEVLSLLKAGVSEEVILYKVHQSPEGIDVTAEDTVKLRAAGASDHLLMELMKTSGSTTIKPGERAPNIQAAPSSATLLLYTSPGGAQVVIDGVPAGTTPYIGNQLEPGQHELYISKRFYRSVSKMITAKVGDKLELKESLELELPGVSVSLSTKSLPKGNNRWTVRGAGNCSVGRFLYVVREGKDEDGRVVLRSQGGTEQTSGSTCLEVYFWLQAKSSLPGGEAPRPDVSFQIEGIDLKPTTLTEIDLVVERDPSSPTGLLCSIANGPGKLLRPAGVPG